MTDRFCALTVVLSKNIRDDDCQPLIDAISMIKGVQEVVPQVSCDTEEYAYYSRFKAKLHNVIKENFA